MKAIGFKFQPVEKYIPFKLLVSDVVNLHPYVAGIDGVKFRRPVVPGDQLVMKAGRDGGEDRDAQPALIGRGRVSKPFHPFY